MVIKTDPMLFKETPENLDYQNFNFTMFNIQSQDTKYSN